MSRKFSVSVYKAFTTSPNGFRLRTGGGVAQDSTVSGRRGTRTKNRGVGTSRSERQNTRRVSRAAVHANPDPESRPSSTAATTALKRGDSNEKCKAHSSEGDIDGDAQSDTSAGRLFSCCATPATDSLRLSCEEAKKTCCTSAAAPRASLSPEDLSFSCSAHAASTTIFASCDKYSKSYQKHVSHHGAGFIPGGGDAKSDPSATRMFSCCATPATDSQRHSFSDGKKTCCSSSAISNCKQEFSTANNSGFGPSCAAPSSRPALLLRPPRSSGGGLKGKPGGVRIFPCTSPVTDSLRFPSERSVLPSYIPASSAHPQQNLSDARIFRCCVTPATHSQRDFGEGWRLDRAETLDLRHQKQTRLPTDLSPIHGSMFEEKMDQRSKYLAVKRSPPAPVRTPVRTLLAIRRTNAIARRACAQAEKARERARERAPQSMVKQINRRQLIFRLCRRRRLLTWKGIGMSNKDKRPGTRPSRLVNIGPPLNLLLRNRLPGVDVSMWSTNSGPPSLCRKTCGTVHICTARDSCVKYFDCMACGKRSSRHVKLLTRAEPLL